MTSENQLGTHSQLNAAPLDRLRDAPLGVCTDEFLARRAARGDNRAFALIYKRHEQDLYRYCRSLVGTPEDAADAMQSAMWLALRALTNGTRPLSVKPWLYRIVHNESMSLLRRRRPEVELEDDHEPTAPSQLHASPHAEVSTRASVRRLFADLKDLTEQQRAVLIMRELNDFKPDEIAQALDISPQAVRQSLYEARRSLQEFEEGRALDCAIVQEQIGTGDGRKLASRKLAAHMRDCSACAALKTASEPRRARVAAFAPVAFIAQFWSWLGGIFGSGSATVAGAGGTAAGASGGLAMAGSTTAGIVGAKGMSIAAAAVLAAGVGGQVVANSDEPADRPASNQQAAIAPVPGSDSKPAFDPLAAPRERTAAAREAADRREARREAISRRQAAHRKAVAERRAAKRQAVAQRQRAARGFGTPGRAGNGNRMGQGNGNGIGNGKANGRSNGKANGKSSPRRARGDAPGKSRGNSQRGRARKPAQPPINRPQTEPVPKVQDKSTAPQLPEAAAPEASPSANPQVPSN